MSEKPPSLKTGPSVEGSPTYTVTEEQLEQARAYEVRILFEGVQLTPEQCAELITELEGLYTAFEQNHDFEALYAITELDPKVAKDHPIREPARQDLPPIISLLRVLEKQHAVTDETYFKLLEGQQRADRAVGTINNGRVDHWRPHTRNRHK